MSSSTFQLQDSLSFLTKVEAESQNDPTHILRNRVKMQNHARWMTLSSERLIGMLPRGNKLYRDSGLFGGDFALFFLSPLLALSVLS